MALTWRDAVSTLAMIVIIIAWAAYMQGSTLWLISSAWATTALVLAAALIGGWVVIPADKLSARPQTRWAVAYRRIAAVIGLIGFTAGVIALISGSAHALQILVLTTVALWGAATLRHALIVPPEQ